ncbi:hypothetical protein [Pedobacter borealis]|uniref:hypothetical protein n=1 Tax=Pedobacter borealis TaxID=475254 RepID=UPI000493453C|nr:hypothetical protein [Pedobacter borealis]
MIKSNINKINPQNCYDNLVNIQPADRIVVPKSDFQLVQHHAIFLGNDQKGDSWFAENIIGKGVLFTKADFFLKNSPKITRIEKFPGNENERRIAIDRAISMKGKKYNLFNFNCEHYSNMVQKNISKSDQINIFIWLALAFVFLLAVFNDNKKYSY